jgi:hypothetical protein
MHRDLREPMEQARRWQADVAKSEPPAPTLPSFELANLDWTLSRSRRSLRQPRQPLRWRDGSLEARPSVSPAFFCSARLALPANASLHSLWDFKKLLGMPEDSGIKEINEQCVVSKFEHSKACSSSYWDRSGTKVLTTSYDDLIRGELRSLERLGSSVGLG